ncbi:MAG: DinB family protein [Cyclobacteriaceae bacterium]
MKNLKSLVNDCIVSFKSIEEKDWAVKKNPDKWSRKEILGHLIDSAINNLQRFTEIQFSPKPYIIRKYGQDDLVKANDYQNVPIGEIIELWVTLNYQIWRVMQKQTDESLSSEVEVEPGKMQSLKWLMDDYIVHLEHHMKQIRN